MPRERRSYSGAEKMAILREHLIEKVPISEVCDKHGLRASAVASGSRKGYHVGRQQNGGPRSVGAAKTGVKKAVSG